MDINLRQAVLANISTNTQDELEDTIVDAIEQGEEKMLPGLGVLFELIWQQSSEMDKQELIDTLEQGIKQSSNE